MRKPASPFVFASVLGILLLIGFQNCAGDFQMKPGLLLESQGSSDLPDGSSGGHDHDHESLEIPLPSASAASSIAVGDILTLAAGKSQGLSISGRALLIRGSEGVTRVQMQVFGLPANKHFGAHVHVASCGSGAGGHYKIDPAISEALATNEIWPAVTTDANGYGFGSTQVNHVARTEAVAIVIHAADNTKIACVDLKAIETPSLVRGGAFQPLLNAPLEAASIKGRAVLALRNNGQTEVRLMVKGLAEGAMYMAHVHSLPCVQGAGGHYKIDPTISEALETNEIWPKIALAAGGYGLGSVIVDHTATSDAQSVVIHGPDGAKLVCADLNGANLNFLALEKGLDRLPELLGSASLKRNLNGTTEFRLSVSGLDPAKSYVAHVHNRPCSVGGGGHYKSDETVTTAIEANEIWLRPSSSDAEGAHFDFVAQQTARPDAISIVLHDPTDSAKLGCADLY